MDISHGYTRLSKVTLQSRCVVVAAVARLDAWTAGRWKDSGGDQPDTGGGKEERRSWGRERADCWSKWTGRHGMLSRPLCSTG